MRILTISVMFLIFTQSCIFSPSADRICPFGEHSVQIFPVRNGFFALSVKEYKNREERLSYRFFDESGRQVCMNETDYPFSFYNFLVREKNSESIFLVSQNRMSGKENLVLEISRDCQSKGKYTLDSKNYETISDILVDGGNIYTCGWAESSNRDILPDPAKPKGQMNKVVVEHDMMMTIYDPGFAEKKKIIRGGSDADYIFSVTKTSDNRIFYTGSVMKFEIDSGKNRILKSTALFVNEVIPFSEVSSESGAGSADLIKRGVDYPSDRNFMPFFISEYNKENLLLITMVRIDGNDFIGVSKGEKEKLVFDTAIYPVRKVYLPSYPVQVREDMIFIRFMNIQSGVMDRLYILDMKSKEAADVWIKGANRIAVGLNGEEILLYYSVVMKPCGESIFRTDRLRVNEIFSNKTLKPEMTEGIFINKIKSVMNLKNFCWDCKD